MPRGVPAVSAENLSEEEKAQIREQIAQRKWETAVMRTITQLNWAKAEKDFDLIAAHSARLYELTKPDEDETKP